MTDTVFIQANARQLLGAKISAFSYKRRSAAPETFDVRLLALEDVPRLMRPGQSILRGGHIRAWDPDDLQSFTPLRFAPPSLMGFAGRALVTDPDCFGVGDVAELFRRDLAGKPMWAVPRPGHNGQADYVDWIELKREERSSIGFLEPEWNSFDRLTPSTRILHTTKRRTQPWKTGLPVDYTLRETGALDVLRRLVNRHYRPHPDPNQEAYVFALLADMMDQGVVDRAELVREMAADHIRHDSLQLIDRYRGWQLFEQAA